MATYATSDDLGTYVADNPDVQLPSDPDAVERLLQAAEVRLDTLLGPYDRQPNGRKLDPSTLDDAQRTALSRACCAVVEHELTVGRAYLVGDSDYVPAGAALAWQPMRTPMRALEELAGSGIRKWSGTVAPDPAPAWPVPTDYPPYAWWW